MKYHHPEPCPACGGMTYRVKRGPNGLETEPCPECKGAGVKIEAATERRRPIDSPQP